MFYQRKIRKEANENIKKVINALLAKLLFWLILVL
jgi:hypothetical protein